MAKKTTHKELEPKVKELEKGTIEHKLALKMEKKPDKLVLVSKLIMLIAGILILFGLYLTSLYSYLLFHCLVEIFSIIVACSIFMLAWNSRRFLDNNYLLFLGIAYLFIGGVDLVHTLAYMGMGIFQGYGSNLPTQLWIGARYMESLSFLIAPLFIRRTLKTNFVIASYILATSLLLSAIFYWNNFPGCFIEPTGLTPFKKISEYIISFILLGSIFLLCKRVKEFDKDVFRLLIVSITLTIFSELAFTFHIHVYGLSNLIGHYLKISSFYIIYKAIIGKALINPYNLLFRDLKKSEEKLRQVYDELEQKVEERTVESRKINEQLMREIEERRSAEEREREQRMFLNNILESLTHPFYVVDANDYTLKLTNSATRSAGLPKGTICYALTHRRDKPCDTLEHPCPLEEVKSTKKPTVVEHIHYDMGGQKRNVEVHAYPIVENDGNINRVIVYCLDITERKRAQEELEKHRSHLEEMVRDRTAELMKANQQLKEEIDKRELVEKALRDSELWLQSVFDSLEEAVFVAKPDRTLVNVNDAAQRMFGYSQEEPCNLFTEVLHVDHEYYLEFGRRIKVAFDQEKIANYS